ncbi:DUF7471 family protein [Halosimplex halophilum]|uniref:DUF7471 family protein n=1 Tax=Halosimplex halophilum TaxID=2559572 RepID=UPI00107F6A4D|nr:hypothetical protein [Halosimplex halophilum]
MTPLRPVAHAAPSPDPVLLGVHLLAGVGSGLLLALAVGALGQRGSRSYLLVVLALAALLARTLVSALAMFGPLDAGLHHFAEHALDATVATFLLGAIYYARSTAPDAPEEPS